MFLSVKFLFIYLNKKVKKIKLSIYFLPLVFYLIRKGNKTRGMVEIEIFVIYTTYREWGVGADVAKWIKAVDCEFTMRGFNSRRSPIKI